MKTNYILIGIVAMVFVAAPFMVSAETYGDKTCIQGWLIHGVLPLYICYNPDGGMDHSFLTYDAMNSYYVPPLEETFIPEITYVYGSGTTTYTYSGN